MGSESKTGGDYCRQCFDQFLVSLQVAALLQLAAEEACKIPMLIKRRSTHTHLLAAQGLTGSQGSENSQGYTCGPYVCLCISVLAAELGCPMMPPKISPLLGWCCYANACPDAAALCLPCNFAKGEERMRNSS